jgi:hypothetical protein
LRWPGSPRHRNGLGPHDLQPSLPGLTALSPHSTGQRGRGSDGFGGGSGTEASGAEEPASGDERGQNTALTRRGLVNPASRAIHRGGGPLDSQRLRGFETGSEFGCLQRSGREALSEFQTQIPRPLAEDLPEFLVSEIGEQRKEGVSRPVDKIRTAEQGQMLSVPPVDAPPDQISSPISAVLVHPLLQEEPATPALLPVSGACPRSTTRHSTRSAGPMLPPAARPGETRSRMTHRSIA